MEFILGLFFPFATFNEIFIQFFGLKVTKTMSRHLGGEELRQKGFLYGDVDIFVGGLN